MSGYQGPPGDPNQQWPGQGGPPQYSMMPPPPPNVGPKRSKAPLIIGLIVGVLVLCCVGGSLVVYFSPDSGTDSSASSGSSSTDNGGGAASPSPTDEDVAGNLDQFHAGDCLLISKNNDVSPTSCSTKGAYEVYLRENGTISDSYCKNTRATTSLYEDVEGGSSEDFVLCIGPASGQ